MHYGVVDESLESIVSLSMLRDDGFQETFDFIVDTGLSEEMVLPQLVVDRLGLIRYDPIVIATGDGRARFVDRYIARILWHDEVREVRAASMGAEFLIGMALLRGSNLSVDAVPGGVVAISELSVPL